jgi:Secretion system C-terminal sorting domain
MQKIFTNLVAASLMLGTVGATAQTQIWPTADTNTINASQFKGAASLFTITRTDTVVPAAHKGWYTKGLVSATAAKKDSAVWQWSATGASRGAYGGGGDITSPSAANGSAIFDSDWLDNIGAMPTVGMGQAPAIHSGELVSPVIDARGYSNITVRFNQYYRNFQGFTYVSWSEDSGRTWKPRIAFNTAIGANIATAASAIESVKLKGSVGTSGFRIKFIFSGKYYFWTVDDIKLMNIAMDLKVNPFIAIAPSYYIQKNQVENMRFLLDIANVGTSRATNVKVQFTMARVVGATNTVIYRDSLAYGTVLTDTTIENKLLPGTLPAALLTVGQYRGTYQVVSDSVDQIPANDALGFTFFVHDSTYRKESGATNITSPHPSNWATPTEPRTWRVGCYYYVKTGVGHTIPTASAYVSNLIEIKGQRVSLGIYEWVDANDDKTIQPAERILVAYGDTLIPQTQTADQALLLFQMKDINSQRWFYPRDNKHYLAMVEFDPTAANLEMDMGFNFVNDYSAFIFMQDSLYRTGLGARRYAPILGIKSDADWTTGAFGHDKIPAVRLNMVAYRVKDEILTAEHKMEVFPNPAFETATLTMDLPHAVNSILVQTLDNNGHLLQEQMFNNVQKDRLSLNIADLPSGTYMLRILTPDGTRMKKLVVLK